MTPIASPVPPDWSDLNAAAVHLDDLGSEGLDGGQDQLLVFQGRDSKAQHISGGGKAQEVSRRKSGETKLITLILDLHRAKFVFIIH